MTSTSSLRTDAARTSSVRDLRAGGASESYTESIDFSESFGRSVKGDCVLLWPISSASSSIVGSRLISDILSTSVIIGAVAGMSGILKT